MDYQGVLSFIGEKFAFATQKSIQFLAELGMQLDETQAKILNIAIILLSIFLIIKLLETPKKLIKYALIFVLVLLGISTIFSFL